MPPTKSPPKPKTESAASAALSLFAQNLEEIRRWYRSASDSGREMGHVVLNELILTNVSVALEYALKGKRWEKPTHNP
jgi:hypothetical protein